MQNFVPRSRIEIFRNERSRSTHWSLNSCFGEFSTIWVHLGPFGCLSKLGEERAELVQKFVPRSYVRILCNERDRKSVV